MTIAGSLWANYMRELDGSEVLETSDGFAIYQVAGAECYIREIYTLPEHRSHHVASKIADQIAEIAKKSGCKYLTGSVRPETNNATRNMLVLIKYGFIVSPVQKGNGLVYFVKPLEN